MGWFVLTTTALVTLSLPWGSYAMAAQDKSIMRRDREVLLRANGATLGLDSHQEARDKVWREFVHRTASSDEYCGIDFELGKYKTSNCTDHIADDAVDRSLVTDEGDCYEAMKEAGLTAPSKHNFTIGYDWYTKHPEGCFMDHCGTAGAGAENFLELNDMTAEEFAAVSANDTSSDPRAGYGSDTCYFYNPSATKPPEENISSGVPVCSRPKLQHGTNDTNGVCPSEFEVVTHERSCYEFGLCMGHCVGQQFRINIMNASLYDEYPKYCFVHRGDDCVYFNQPRVGMADPQRPVGTPICNVSQILHFPAVVGNYLPDHYVVADDNVVSNGIDSNN